MHWQNGSRSVYLVIFEWYYVTMWVDRDFVVQSESELEDELDDDDEEEELDDELEEEEESESESKSEEELLEEEDDSAAFFAAFAFFLASFAMFFFAVSSASFARFCFRQQHKKSFASLYNVLVELNGSGSVYLA